jgi:hypothetical protein
MKNKFSINRGQSLVEIIIVIAMSVVILPALLTGMISSRQGKVQQAQRTQAIYLLNETVDAVRSVREKGWASFAMDGEYHTASVSGSWALASGSAMVNGFNQKIIISDVGRDLAGAIASSGGTIDPSSKKVDVLISWDKPYLSTVSANLYLTRYLSNNSFIHTTVEDFNHGALNNTKIVNLAGGEVSLTNNNKAKWCSPAFSTDNNDREVTIDLPDGPPVAVAATASADHNTPNDVFVATAPYATSSVKLAYVNVTANTDWPIATLAGKFTLDSSQYSNSMYVPSGIGLTNTFKTNDVKYYKSSTGKTYALLATNLPDKEVVAVLVNDGNPSNDNTTTGEYQDPVNKIYKYWTFFNTTMYGVVLDSDTGFMDSSANAVDTGGDNDGFGTNPSRAYTDNSQFAVDTNSGSGTGTDCLGTDKDKHRFYNYNFSLPTGATVKGVEVRLDAKVDNTSGSPKMCVQLSWDGGTTWTTAKSTSTLTTSEKTYTLGGSSDMWGRTWSNANFDNSSFRLRVINVASNTSRDFSLDWAAVKVYSGGGGYDQAPFDYGATTLTTIGDRGYIASGGYLYVFNLSNIDSKTTNSGLDMVGCRIELDGYDCKRGTTASVKKYDSGETGTAWSDVAGAIHNDCSDGGNIELYATNDIYPVQVGTNTYIYVAVGGVTNPEFEIVNVTSVPTGSTSPAVSNSSCGTISGGNSGWKRLGTYDFNSNSNTEEAANSVYAKSDGTRAYISSNGGVDGDDNGQPDSKQFYVLNTSNKSSPTFLSGSPSSGPSSGYYYGTGANAEMYPRRSLTVLNGDRVVLVGKDSLPANGNNAQEYQVLNSEDEATPTYCGGLNFDRGLNDLTSVSESDGDNFVYMVANTEDKQLKIVEGGPDDGLYVAGGTFESSYDAIVPSSFYRFSANINQPSQTTIKAQVGVGAPVDGSCTSGVFNYVGPNGNPGLYFTTDAGSISGTIPFGDSGSYQNPNRCFKYRFSLDTTDYNQTPTLYDINVNYSP